jgi:creatinine amidohydrolase
MIEWARLTSDEVKTLDRNLPVIIPLGLIEAHGHHLSLGLDNDTAGYFSRRIAEAAGVILAPTISYGFADAMREYPGTIGVTVETLSCVIHDIALMFCHQGFKKQIYLSGHGANRLACELAFTKAWRCRTETCLLVIGQSRPPNHTPIRVKPKYATLVPIVYMDRRAIIL